MSNYMETQTDDELHEEKAHLDELQKAIDNLLLSLRDIEQSIGFGEGEELVNQLFVELPAFRNACEIVAVGIEEELDNRQETNKS